MEILYALLSFLALLGLYAVYIVKDVAKQNNKKLDSKIKETKGYVESKRISSDVSVSFESKQLMILNSEQVYSFENILELYPKVIASDVFMVNYKIKLKIKDSKLLKIDFSNLEDFMTFILEIEKNNKDIVIKYD